MYAQLCFRGNLISRHVANILVTFYDVLRQLGPAALEPGHRVFGAGWPAMIDELALVRAGAVRADNHVWQWAGNRFPRPGNQFKNGWLECPHLVGQVVLEQQPVVIAVARVHELVVDVRQRYGSNLDSGAAQHPVLDGAIEDVIVLHGR